MSPKSGVNGTLEAESPQRLAIFKNLLLKNNALFRHISAKI